jgi:hypothetical protein
MGQTEIIVAMEYGQLGVVSTVARKPPLSVAMAIFGIVCNGLQSADTHTQGPLGNHVRSA